MNHSLMIYSVLAYKVPVINLEIHLHTGNTLLLQVLECLRTHESVAVDQQHEQSSIKSYIVTVLQLNKNYIVHIHLKI